jgi:hypothetical protein
MNRGLWIARKNYLCMLITKLSNHYGGDDDLFISRHCAEIVESAQGEAIEDVIACYEEMLNKLTNLG